jgi:hypothetical protein
MWSNVRRKEVGEAGGRFGRSNGIFPHFPSAQCGNGVIDAGEQCDGGNFCTACVCNLGYESTSPVTADCTAKCGNGVLDAGGILFDFFFGIFILSITVYSKKKIC